jgi:MFS superfamily sulfate permease-like transporter
MAVLFLCSGLIMPYVPTVLASVLVLFIGIELFLEAIWEASKTLAWMEYAVVVATLAACTFLGFAEGFGVGIGAATVVYFMYGVMDSVRIFSRNELADNLFIVLDFGSRRGRRGGMNGTSCSR